jgi:hypothetical protein
MSALDLILAYLVGLFVRKEAKKVNDDKERKERKRYKLNTRLSHNGRQGGEEWNAVDGGANALYGRGIGTSADLGKIYGYCGGGENKRGKYNIYGNAALSHNARAADEHAKLKVEHTCRHGEHKADEVVPYDAKHFCRPLEKKNGANHVYGRGDEKRYQLFCSRCASQGNEYRKRGEQRK